MDSDDLALAFTMCRAGAATAARPSAGRTGRTSLRFRRANLVSPCARDGWSPDRRSVGGMESRAAPPPQQTRGRALITSAQIAPPVDPALGQERPRSTSGTPGARLGAPEMVKRHGTPRPTGIYEDSWAGVSAATPSR